MKKQTGSATNDATQDKIQTLQNMITIRANNSYEQRMNDCNERSKNNWQSTSTSTPVRREASDGTSQK